MLSEYVNILALACRKLLDTHTDYSCMQNKICIITTKIRKFCAQNQIMKSPGTFKGPRWNEKGKPTENPAGYKGFICKAQQFKQ